MSFCKSLSKIFALLLVAGKIACGAHAQVSLAGIRGSIAKIDTFYSRLPAEKLYLQFDKPYYSVGDTIWFKGYLLNAGLTYSPLSSRLYVELINESNKVVKTLAVPVSLGITWGNMALSPNDIKGGSYTIRAYTTWMRNFGGDSFFTQALYIADPENEGLEVKANSALAAVGDNGTVKIDLQFSGLDSKPVAMRDMQISVLDGKRTIFKGAAQTAADGSLNTSFPLPASGVKNLSLVAKDKTNSKVSVAIPVVANRAKDVDIQFMPEGGSMLAGIPAHIGFKAIGEDGKSVDVSGTIMSSSNNQQVVTFQSLYKGMGVIDILPEAGETYTAKVTLPNGQTKDVALPVIKTTGAVLRVRNYAARDTMDITIYLSDEQVKQNVPLYLIGQAREVVCFAATIPAGRQSVSVHVAKSLFPTGIAHFTLLNISDQPLSERLTFIDHQDNFKISINTGNKTYAPRDSIPVTITVNDDAGKPVVGSFSVAVTDDGQVKKDDNSDGSIVSDLLLTADLKGTVEGPGYYFTSDKDAWLSLDALLLTQGWIGYDWKNINIPPKPLFDPEYTHMVRGNVTTVINKPYANADVALISTGKYHFVMDTVTNSKGVFTFTKIPPVDSTTFVLEARNGKSRKPINAGISIDDVSPPATKDLNLPPVSPWYVNSSATVLNYVKSNADYRKELESATYGINGRALKQVNIKDQAIIKGSLNLNGAGNADQVLGADELEKADKITLFDLLQKQVSGFHINSLPKSHDQDFFIRDKRARFIFDGVDINRFYEPVSGLQDEYYFFVKQYLDYFTAEDIKGIEVLYSAKYIAQYNSQMITDNGEFLALDPTGPRGSENAYLEITTRAGAGPFMKKATGIYIYKPMATTLPKQFYRPRYLVKADNKKFTDLRSTIHWQPNVVTNKNGEAFVSFFAADKPGTYTLVVEGSDLNGKIGYKTEQITVGAQ